VRESDARGFQSVDVVTEAAGLSSTELREDLVAAHRGAGKETFALCCEVLEIFVKQELE
jgi:hypothetical protein